MSLRSQQISPLLIGAVSSLIALFVVLIIVLSSGEASFPRLTEQFYLGTVKLDLHEEEATFLLLNDTAEEQLFIFPLGDDGVAGISVDADASYSTVALPFANGKRIEEVTFLREEQHGEEGVLRGVVSTEQGLSGLWTLTPVTSVGSAEEEHAQGIAQVRALLEETNKELLTLGRARDALRDERRTTTSNHTSSSNALPPLAEKTVPDADMQALRATLERQEAALLQDLSRTSRYSERGRAVELAAESLERERRWFEAQLVQPKEPRFFDPDDEYYYRRAQRAEELEELIEEEEQKIQQLYAEQEGGGR